MKTIVKEAKFYEDNEICPTCEQDINANLKTEKLCHTKNKAKEIQSGIKKVETEIKNVESSLKSAEEKNKAFTYDLQKEIVGKDGKVVVITEKFSGDVAEL
jgi:septal ring factor EnvC (AmiA/AmiB activator)